MKWKHYQLTLIWLAVVVWIQSCQPASIPPSATDLVNETPSLSVPTSITGTIPTASPVIPTQTSQPAPVESQEVTPSIQPTATGELPELKAELFAFFGGGGPSCASGPPQSEAPEIEVLSHSFPTPAQDTILCLYNFPLNEDVTLAMIDPSGESAGQEVFRVGSQRYRDENATFQEYSLLEVPLSLPLSLPRGVWRIRALARGEQTGGDFHLGVDDPVTPDFQAGTPIVTHSPILPATQITPLDSRLRAPYQAGDTIRVQGVNFEPEMQFRAGLYQGWENLSLVNSFVVTTDQKGTFTHDLMLDDNLPSGQYSIMPSLFITEDEESDNSYVNNDYYARFSIQNEPTRTMVGSDCTTETSLVVAGTAYLADDQANNLRLSPGADGLRIGRLQPGERMVILDGPYCADGLLWWNVHSQDTNLVGWTAEGDEQETWLLPVP